MDVDRVLKHATVSRDDIDYGLVVTGRRRCTCDFFFLGVVLDAFGKTRNNHRVAVSGRNRNLDRLPSLHCPLRSCGQLGCLGSRQVRKIVDGDREYLLHGITVGAHKWLTTRLVRDDCANLVSPCRRRRSLEIDVMVTANCTGGIKPEPRWQGVQLRGQRSIKWNLDRPNVNRGDVFADQKRFVLDRIKLWIRSQTQFHGGNQGGAVRKRGSDEEDGGFRSIVAGTRQGGNSDDARGLVHLSRPPRA